MLISPNSLKGKVVETCYRLDDCGVVSIAFTDGSYINIISQSPVLSMVHDKNNIPKEPEELITPQYAPGSFNLGLTEE